MIFEALAAQLDKYESTEIVELVGRCVREGAGSPSLVAIPFCYDANDRHIRFRCPKWMEPVRERLLTRYSLEVAERKLQNILWYVALHTLEEAEADGDESRLARPSLRASSA